MDHFKKNSNGKYKDEKAARLEVKGTAFVGIAGEPVQPVEFAKVETNTKTCKATFTYGGLTESEIPFVEGCGGVSPNSPLWACACSGNNPGTNPGFGGGPGGSPGGGFGGGGTGGGEGG